jgi:hypothetical protein
VLGKSFIKLINVCAKIFIFFLKEIYYNNQCKCYFNTTLRQKFNTINYKLLTTKCKNEINACFKGW